MGRIKLSNEYRYLIYADFGHGMKLAAWYDDYEDAKKEAAFLKRKGHKVEIKNN